MADRARLLGPMQVEVGGGERAPLGEMTSALLVYLAARDSWVLRSDLLSLLYGDRPSGRAHQNLRQLLYAAAGLTPSLKRERHRVRWDVDTDHAEFLVAATDMDVDTANRLWRGDLAEGLEPHGAAGFVDWLASERERLRRVRRNLLHDHATHLVSLGRHTEAATHLRDILASDPLDEDAARALIAALACTGRIRDAIRVYEAFRSHVRRELDIEPAPLTRDLVASLKAGDVRIGGPIGVSRKRIPRLEGEIHGREDVIGAIDRSLAAGVRCLTLTGMGGSGKSRVAMEWASNASLLRAVAWTELSDANTVADFVAHIGRACGIHGGENAKTVSDLARELDGREVVVVLDDPGDVAVGARVANDLLRGTTGPSILATSRAPLGCAQERTLHVGGLEAPAGGRLLLDAALRANVDLPREPDRTSLAERLSERVGGLPLALELAAGWLVLMPLDRLLDRVDGADSILPILEPDGGGLSDAVANTVASLAPELHAAFGRLGVFAGSIAPDAANALGVSPTQIVALLERGLVRRSNAGSLSLHPLIADRARAILEELEDEEEASTLHATYFLDLLGADGLSDERRPQVLADLEASLPNLRRAWDTAVRRRMHDALERALPGWRELHRAATREHELHVSAAAATPKGPALRRATFLHTSLVARLRATEQPDDAMVRAFAELRDAFAQHGSLAECGSARHMLLLCELFRKNPSAAESAGREALAYAESIGANDLRGEILGHLAITSEWRRDHGEAERRLREAIAATRRERPLAADRATANLALLSIFRGHYPDAIHLAHATLSSERTGADAEYRLRRHHLLGHAYRDAGLLGESEAVFREQLSRLDRWEIRARLRDQMLPVALHHLTRIAGATGKLVEAQGFLDAHAAVAGGSAGGRIRWLTDAGWLARISGDAERADHLMAQAIAIHQSRCGDPSLDSARLHARVLAEGARAAAAMGHMAAACRRVATALDVAIESRLEALVLSVLPAACDLLDAVGSRGAARALLHRVAHDPRSSSDARREASEIVGARFDAFPSSRSFGSEVDRDIFDVGRDARYLLSDSAQAS